jgi:glutaredoxin 3
MTNKKVITLYSTPVCAYCYTMKDYLKEKGINYEEINIQENEAARKKMEEISGQKNVPVTVIDGQVLTGWDKVKLNQLLEI